MPGLGFVIPIGAGADVKELEFIIALQQTSKQTRPNATVSSQDIKALLNSRYGLSITHEQALEVVRGLGGGDSLFKYRPSKTEKNAEGVQSADLGKTERETQKSPVQRAEDMLGCTVSFARKLFFRKQSDEAGEVFDDDLSQRFENSPSVLRSSRTDKLEELHRLHLAHQQGETVDPKRMSIIKDKVTSSLQRRVLKKYTTTRHLNARKSGVSVTAEEAELLKVVAGSDDDTSVDSGGESFPESSGDENDQTEFLDLLQILSTVLIPIFAQISHELNLAKPKKAEPPERAGVFSDLQADCAGPGKRDILPRVKARFEAYGRNKLNLDADRPQPYPPSVILEKAKKALIQRALPTMDAPVVDESLVKLLLISHGEIERAMNRQLVREMVEVAHSKSGFLDDEALINAISSDLSFWNIACNDVHTTFFDDVFGTTIPRKEMTLVQPATEADIESVPSPDTRNKGAGEKNLGDEPPPQDHSNDPLYQDHPNDPLHQDHSNNPLPEDHSNEPLLQDHSDEPLHQDHSNYPLPQDHSNDPLDQDHPNDLLPQKRSSFSKSTKSDVKKSLNFRIDQTGIDFVLDSQISFVILSTIWLSFILATSIYGAILYEYANFSEECQNESKYVCLFADTVIKWAILGCVLSGFGILYVLPLSLGNAPSDRTPKSRFFAGFVAIAYTTPPYVAATTKDGYVPMFPGVLKFHLVVGLALAGMFFLQALFTYFFDTDHPFSLPLLVRPFASTGCWNSEMKIHRAAKYKLDKLISHALQLHERVDTSTVAKHVETSVDTSNDHIMRNYVLHGEKKIEAGGILWTWWQIVDGSLFEKEGIWLNARLRVIQMAQLVLGSFCTVFGLILVERGASNADKKRKAMEEDDLPSYIMDIFPTGHMVRLAFYPAVLCGCIVMAVVTALYIPSAVGTIFKYRYKTLPSLGSVYFEKYRASVDTTYYNTGNAIYGMLGMALLIYIVVGGIIFLFLWPPTQSWALLILVWCLGLGVTVGLKMALTMTCRMIQYRAFYRIRPSAARITSLALECWYLGLAGSVLLARIGQFLFAAVFWIGRIDVTFLSEDVSLFGYSFDYVPTHFSKDLLVHEAHRHPYIERLAQMYLMKLRHGDQFVSNAGSAWRQLLVAAMMPWVIKYRVFSHERRMLSDSEEKEVEGLERDEARIYNADVPRGVLDLGGTVGKEVTEAGVQVIGAGKDALDGVQEVLVEVGGGLFRHTDERTSPYVSQVDLDPSGRVASQSNFSSCD